MKKKLPSVPMAVRPRLYSLGEVFKNQYLGNKITEVLDSNKKRAGWLWEHTSGCIVVSPYLGFYVWYAPGGEAWTAESGAMWLTQHR